YVPHFVGQLLWFFSRTGNLRGPLFYGFVGPRETDLRYGHFDLDSLIIGKEFLKGLFDLVPAFQDFPRGKGVLRVFSPVGCEPFGVTLVERLDIGLRSTSDSSLFLRVPVGFLGCGRTGPCDTHHSNDDCQSYASGPCHFRFHSWSSCVFLTGTGPPIIRIGPSLISLLTIRTTVPRLANDP